MPEMVASRALPQARRIVGSGDENGQTVGWCSSVSLGFIVVKLLKLISHQVFPILILDISKQLTNKV